MPFTFSHDSALFVYITHYFFFYTFLILNLNYNSRGDSCNFQASVVWKTWVQFSIRIAISYITAKQPGENAKYIDLDIINEHAVTSISHFPQVDLLKSQFFETRSLRNFKVRNLCVSKKN